MNTLQIVPKSENIPHYLTHETDLIKAFLRGRNHRTIDAYRIWSEKTNWLQPLDESDAFLLDFASYLV